MGVIDFYVPLNVNAYPKEKKLDNHNAIKYNMIKALPNMMGGFGHEQ
jgi:hypothetical protein